MATTAPHVQDPATVADPAAPLRTPAQAEALVVALVQRHADDLIRVARRHTSCPDDANDAYQRALEQLVRHARRLEAATAHRWLFVVLRHEAQAVRRARAQLVGVEEAALDALEARWEPSPEEAAVGHDEVLRAAEALGRLKVDEVRALWLRASGLSYAEIEAETGWTYTKVNRCLAEGRAALVRHRADLESGDACARFAPLLSASLDAELGAGDRRELRRHLRGCGGCRAELGALHDAGRGLGVVLPPVLLAGGAAGHDHVPAFLLRLYESVAGSVHERAATLASSAEPLMGTKVAVVAAATAALAAGGGAVAVKEHAGSSRPPRAQAAQRASVAPAPSPPATTTTRTRPELRASVVGLRTASGAAVASPARAASPTRSAAARRRQRSGASPTRDEFAGSGATTASAGSSGSSSVAAGEFAPEPAAAPAASAPAPAPASSAVGGAASVAPAPSGGSSASAGAAGPGPAASEFGGP